MSKEEGEGSGGREEEREGREKKREGGREGRTEGGGRGVLIFSPMCLNRESICLASTSSLTL